MHPIRYCFIRIYQVACPGTAYWIVYAGTMEAASLTSTHSAAGTVGAAVDGVQSLYL